MCKAMFKKLMVVYWLYRAHYSVVLCKKVYPLQHTPMTCLRMLTRLDVHPYVYIAAKKEILNRKLRGWK